MGQGLEELGQAGRGRGGGAAPWKCLCFQRTTEGAEHSWTGRAEGGSGWDLTATSVVTVAFQAGQGWFTSHKQQWPSVCPPG